MESAVFVGTLGGEVESMTIEPVRHLRWSNSVNMRVGILICPGLAHSFMTNDPAQALPYKSFCDIQYSCMIDSLRSHNYRNGTPGAMNTA